MKPYFAKWLTVEGEVQIGDHYFQTCYAPRQLGVATDVEAFENEYYKQFPKVKLFLCSRKFEVGDEIIHLSFNSKKRVFVKREGNNCFFTPVDENGIHGNCSIYYARQNMAKVIGEISPNATWVKDGDEFEEENIVVYHDGGNFYCKIKGPCGHFH